jgi:hypothetical protein
VDRPGGTYDFIPIGVGHAMMVGSFARPLRFQAPVV